jgi:hypothetical protein
VLLGFGEGHLVVDPVEAVAAIGQSVGPGNERRAVGAVARDVGWVRIQDGSVPDPVATDRATHLDNGDALVSPSDVELLADGQQWPNVAPFVLVYPNTKVRCCVTRI